MRKLIVILVAAVAIAVVFAGMYVMLGGRKDTPPKAPTGLTASVRINLVYLSWTPPLDKGSGIDGYYVYRSNLSLAYKSNPVAICLSSSYSEIGLASGTYRYVVKAYNSAGVSEPSDEVIVAVNNTWAPAPGDFLDYSITSGFTQLQTLKYRVENVYWNDQYSCYWWTLNITITSPTKGIRMLERSCWLDDIVIPYSGGKYDAPGWQPILNLENLSTTRDHSTEATTVSTYFGSEPLSTPWGVKDCDRWRVSEVDALTYQDVWTLFGVLVRLESVSEAPVYVADSMDLVDTNLTSIVSSGNFTLTSGGTLPPAAPADLVAVATGSTVDLSWSSPSGTDSIVVGYDVYRTLVAGSYISTPSSRTPVSHCTESGLSPGVYYYIVRAYNDAGESPSSNEIAATIRGGGGAWDYQPGDYVNYSFGSGWFSGWTNLTISAVTSATVVLDIESMMLDETVLQQQTQNKSTWSLGCVNMNNPPRGYSPSYVGLEELETPWGLLSCDHWCFTVSYGGSAVYGDLWQRNGTLIKDTVKKRIYSTDYTISEVMLTDTNVDRISGGGSIYIPSSTPQGELQWTSWMVMSQGDTMVTLLTLSNSTIDKRWVSIEIDSSEPVISGWIGPSRYLSAGDFFEVTGMKASTGYTITLKYIPTGGSIASVYFYI